MLQEYGNRRLGQLISTECVLSPVPRETLFADLQKGGRLVAAGAVNSGLKWGGPICFGDKASDILGPCGVPDGNGYVCAGLLQLIGGGFQFGCIAARNCHGMPTPRKSTRYSCSQAARCTHAHN